MKPEIEHKLYLAGLIPGNWVTVPEAAKQLGTTVPRTWSLIQKGSLISFKVGARRYVSRQSIEQVKQYRANKSKKNASPFKTSEQTTPEHPNTQTSTHPYLHTSTLPHTHTGLAIDGRIWLDRANDDVWMPTDRAAEFLLANPNHLSYLAKRGKLRRRWAHPVTHEEIDPTQPSIVHRLSSIVAKSKIQNPKSKIGHRPVAMYSSRDLGRLLEERNNRGRNRSFPANDHERPIWHGRIRTTLEPPPGDSFLTPAEAANLLEVNPTRITALVAAGTLFGWQSEPGKPGCPLHLSANQVHRYLNNPERLRRREAWYKGRDPNYKREKQLQQRKLNDFQENNHLWNEPAKALKHSHGEYYTTWQAAEALGVSRNTINTMRRRGRLQGCRSEFSADQKFNLRRYWFYKKDDIHALKNDREYQRRRKSYRKSRFPEEYLNETY